MTRLRPALKRFPQIVAVSIALISLGLFIPRTLLAQTPTEKGQAAWPLPPQAYHLPQHQLSRQLENTLSPTQRETSSFMLGRVAVAVIFPQSDGSLDPSTEQWTQAHQHQILAEIETALTWWETLNPAAPLSFILAATHTFSTRVEPIARPHSDQALWISDSLAGLGFTEGTHFDRVLAYNNQLRQTHATDWAFTIFVLNSTADSDNRLADGYFAYAYLGGPFTVLTSEVGNYGLHNFASVIAHEIGHIFNALDQYPTAGQACTLTAGYLSVANQNSQLNCASNVPSLMRGQVSPFQQRQLDPYARGQIGWQDSNANGILDPLDITPALSQLEISPGLYENVLTFSGLLTASPWPSSLGRSHSINRWQNLSYQLDGQGRWYPITPSDGAFDSLHEGFTFTTVALSSGWHSLCLRAEDQFGQQWFLPLGQVNVVDPVAQTLNTHWLSQADALPVRGNYSLHPGEALTLHGQAISQDCTVVSVTAWLTALNQPDFLRTVSVEPLDGTFDSPQEVFTLTLDSTALLPGQYTLTLCASDALGHVESTPATLQLEVLAPEARLVFLPVVLTGR